MGGGGKGGTTTTQKMEIPPEVMARYNAVNARAEAVAQTPYQKYSNDPNAFVAPLTATQQAGIQNTNAMAGTAQPYYGVAAGLTAMGAGSADPQGLNVGQYYNPLTSAVAAPTLQALQQQQAVERSSLMSPQSARSFGGDRSGLVAANLARQQALGTSQAMAPIYKQAYDDALKTAQQQQGVGLAAQQANLQRLGQAGAQFGQLGSGAQAAGLAGGQAQLAAGQTEQQTSQAGLQALYNQFQQQQAYPFQIAQFLSNIATGTGALSGNTTTSNTTGGGGFFSDERLKENIKQVGKTNDGQNIYRYNYKGDPRTQIGLLAQEVARDHPEAVGRRDGYLTVDYRDATDDAVRSHKADGGSTDTGMSAYDIDAPSAMMGGSPVSQEMLAGLVPKPMTGFGGLPITTGAMDPGAAGLLAPKATGVSPGSIEGARAQLSTLEGADMGKSQSGQEYFDQKKQQLRDFLAANGAASQGGLVSGPGQYSRGGYAEGGYMNPALQYYGPQAGKGGLGAGGPYGAQLTPIQAQMMRAAELSRPQQKSGIDQANQIAGMVGKGYELFKGLPSLPGSTKGDRLVTQSGTTSVNRGLGGADATITSGVRNPTSGDVYSGPKVDGAKSMMRVSDLGGGDQFAGLVPEQMPEMMPEFEYPDAMFAARGGMIYREHHAGLGPVGGSMPYGSVDEDNPLGDVLTATQQRPEMMQPGKMGKPAPQPSGAQQLSQMAGQAKGLFDKGKNVYDFAAKKLSGEATGLAGQPVSVGSATATPLAEVTTGLAPEGLAVGAAPAAEIGAGVAGAGEAGAGLAAGAAGAAEAGAGLAGAAEAGAGLAGVAGAAEAGAGLAGLAGVAEGAGLIGGLASGAGILEALPLFALFSDESMKHDIESVGRLNDGQPVYRYKYNGDDKTRMGLMAQDVEQSHPEAVGGLGGIKMVDYRRATDDAARQRHSDGKRVPDVDQNGDPIPMVDEAAPRDDRMNFAPDEARLSGLAAAPVPPRDIPNNATPGLRVTREEPTRLASFASDVGDLASGLGKTVTDAGSNFWVPALAGIGSMLASPNKRLLAAIGDGLVGGTGAYTALQKQNADLMKQRFDIAKSTFRGPIMNSNEEWTWEDTRTGEMLLQPEYQRRYHALVGGSAMPGSTYTPADTGDVAPPPVRRGPPSIVDAAKDTISGPPPRLEPRAVPKPAPKPVPEAEPEPGAASNIEKPVAKASDEKTLQQLRVEALEDAKNWEGSDASTDPRILLPQVADLNGQIKQLEQQAERQNALARKTAERNPQQGGIFQGNATALMAQAERLRKERDDKVTAAQKAIDGAVQFAVKEREARIAEGVKRDFAPEITSTGEEVLLPPGAQMPRAAAPKPTAAQLAAPKVAAVDGQTGQLTLARPVAPAGGGLIQMDPNLPPGTKLKTISGAAKNLEEVDKKFLEDITEKAPAIVQSQQRLNSLVNAFKLFQSGSIEGNLAGAAAFAKSFGYPELAAKIASGDPEAVQWVQKTAPNLVLDTLKAATPRFAQSEFNTIAREGVPEPNKLPGANFQMVKEMIAMMNRNAAFTASWKRASQEEGWRSPTAYYEAWKDANPLKAFEKAAERQMGNFAGMPLPPSSDWTPGVNYVVPKDLSPSQMSGFTKMGLKAGDIFRYNGRDAEQAISAVPRQQLYSTPGMGY
jgi:hypothetical protein